MVYQVPASKKSIKQNRFEFAADGKTLSIPLMKFLSVRAAEEFEAGRTVAGLLAGADSDAARDAIRSMDSDQLEGFVAAWQEASGVEVGESPASSES